MLRLGIVSAGLLLIALAPFALADAPGPVRATEPVPVEMDVPETTTDAAADSAVVTVFNFGYEDSDTESSVSLIGAGSSVTWFWVEGIHTVTEGVASGLDVVPPQFDSGVKRPSDSNPLFTVVFTDPGVYEYYCGLHPSMHGTVVVVP